MESLTVGVLFSQRGFSRWYGSSQLRGTILAIDEINLNGGLDGRMIDPIIFDVPCGRSQGRIIIRPHKWRRIAICPCESGRPIVLPCPHLSMSCPPRGLGRMIIRPYRFGADRPGTGDERFRVDAHSVGSVIVPMHRPVRDSWPVG